MRLASSRHWVSTEATGMVKTVSEQTLRSHTTAVGLMPSAQVAVLALPIAQMGKLRTGPIKSKIKEEVNCCVANSF